MAKRIRITFERGGTIYASFMEKEAPKAVEIFCSTLPNKVKMQHGRYAGPAMFFDTGLDQTAVPRENIVTEKSVGMLSMTLGTEQFPGKAVHIFYRGDMEICNTNEEIFLAKVEDQYLDKLVDIGESVWLDGPDQVLFELVD